MIVQQHRRLANIPEIKDYYDLLPVFATQEYADYLSAVSNYSISWFFSIDDSLNHYLIPFAINK